MSTQTYVTTSVHVADDVQPEVGFSDPDPAAYRPNGLAHLRLGRATLVLADPHAAAALADAAQEAQRLLRRAEIAAMLTAAVAPEPVPA